MKTTSICRRCHRLKSVDLTHYCVGCRTELRNAEKRRPARAESIDLTKSDPPPPPAPKNALTFIEPNLDSTDVSRDF